jgi:glycosyltransferase involved in cell wall biosynthesis
MAKIKKELPNICLFMAGDGPLRPQLENLARTFNIDDRITFAGPIAFTGMPRFFRQGHLYLQTSRHESQGMSVLEAMACGLPVIGTPVGVTAELAAMPATANPDELAAQALKVLCDPARYESERQKARQLVVEEYSLDKTVQRFVSLYHQLSRPQ